MPYIPAGRKHGIAFVAMLVAGVLLAAQPAVAKPKPSGPNPPSGPQSLSPSTYQAIESWLAATNISSSSCADPPLSQPFLANWNDSNYYALAPGQSDSNFSGSNWFLANGANITSATLVNGSTSSVLDLPSGAFAVSPPMCLAFNYPSARAMVRTLAGTDSLDVLVAYLNGSSYQIVNGGTANGNGNGNGNAWGLSGQINLQPSSNPGWQIARFVLYADGSSSEFQLYNFYVDPYSKH